MAKNNFFKHLHWKLQAMKNVRRNKKNQAQILKACIKTPNHLEVRGPVEVRQGVHLDIGSNVIIGPGAVFYGDGLISLGNNVQILDDFMVFASKSAGVSIGDNTLIGPRCYVNDSDHEKALGSDIISQGIVSSPISIGKGCWIGANVTILRGAIIHDGAVIGAGAVVKGEIPANAIAVGVPAKVVKYRE
jgi:acetyltransferase-like isoleucine patch superfamily enzyme